MNRDPETGKFMKANEGNGNETVAAQVAALRILSDVTDRLNLAGALGMSYGGKRNLYQALGYPDRIEFRDYMSRYRRQDIAKAVINRPVRACWRKRPRITESQDTETPFETAWNDLVKAKHVFHYLARADRLAGIGKYSVIFLGLDDGLPIDQPVTSAKSLLYLSVFSEGNATVSRYVDDRKNERYGLPEIYTLALKAGKTTRQTPVHWSRVIHVTEDVLEDPNEGTPKLEAIWNRLQDLELLSGGSAEMFWRGAFPGTAFTQQPGTTIDPQRKPEFEKQIEEYVHGFRRHLLLSGIDPKELAQQIADPSNHVSVQIDLISAATGIPKRILIGSERGELSSQDDAENWGAQTEERQLDHCEPTILRAFIDRLILLGPLPAPGNDYEVQWPPVVTEGPKQVAEVAQLKAQALAAYASAPGASEILIPEIFLRWLGLKPEEIDENNLVLDGMAAEGAKDEEDAAAAEADQAEADAKAAEEAAVQAVIDRKEN